MTAGAIDLHYVEEGAGPLVVLVHGFPEFWYSWRKQIPAIAAAGFRVVAPDLRGYNESSKPKRVGDYKLTAIAADLISLIESLGPPCVLVGHDWGASAAWLVAMMRPDLLRKLAVLNMPHPAGLMREIRRSSRQKAKFVYQFYFQPPVIPEVLMPLTMPFVLRRMGRFTREDLREYRRSWRDFAARRGMCNYYRALRKFRGELRNSISRVETPTLLIWSEHEPVVTREATEDLDEWVPNLRLARVAGAGHFVQTDEPEVVSDLLIGFARE